MPRTEPRSQAERRVLVRNRGSVHRTVDITAQQHILPTGSPFSFDHLPNYFIN